MNFLRLNFQLLKVGHCSHPECIAMRGGRWENTLFPALCGLITHPTRGHILFDTGYSQHFFDATAPFPERLYRWTTPVKLTPEETLLSQLAARGIRAKDINYVLISHFHGDHIAGIKDFPNAQFIVSRSEYDSARLKSRLGGLIHAFLPALLPADFSDRVIFVEDFPTQTLPSELAPFSKGFDIFNDASLMAVSLPGHTRGQLGAVFRGADHRLMFMVADACWSTNALTKNQPPTWIASRIFDSLKNYQTTFDRLRQAAVHPEAAIFIPSHCEQTWKKFQHGLHHERH
jgi:glyoxylase-like metal-dependent hydrolase (beta-lactamase superfamily II)